MTAFPLCLGKLFLRLSRLSAGLTLGIMLVPHQASAASDNLFYAPPAAAEDSPSFSGQAELGYTSLSGNSNSETLLAKGTAAWFRGPWTHTLRAQTTRVEDNNEVSTEQYLLGARERYSLQGPHYLFGLARIEKDRFSGFDNQFTTIIGYGRQLLDGPDHSLSIEGGPGYRRDDYETGGSEDLAVGYAAADYQYRISDTARFVQQLSIEATQNEVTNRSYSAVTVALTSQLALKFSHEIRSNTNPPDEASVHTDRTTAASILYNF
ncbi:DUF481 domain-containing protein [Phytohalomonas tamaricis]|uniref:DUF481 domain-containing protein n=1 Tax=Phytohalomonas tamaricis TaxID=2081032 RepID=UPI0021D45EFD|nr:DUF481 domain-containing protein [Phytohalomonas tamaricis]